jgi:hypothetical protein
VSKGKKLKDEPGQEHQLPRFPGENNGGKAYYLAESFTAIFGVRKESGETLPLEPKARSDRNPIFAFRHFWKRVSEAYIRQQDDRLKALLVFLERYLPEREGSVGLFEWLEWRPNENSRNKALEWHGRASTGAWTPLAKMPTFAFQIEGVNLFVPNKADSLADPIWNDWAETYAKEAFAEPEDEAFPTDGSRKTVCLITGEVGLPVARSHKPKILGVPGLAQGGYVVSFAKEAPAFSSYGFEMGENAPVGETAAAAYALALNDLLASDESSFRVGDVAFCFWAGRSDAPSVFKTKPMLTANPKVVADFLKDPFAGVERPIAVRGPEDRIARRRASRR